MKKPTIVWAYFQTSTSFLHVYRISWLENLKKRKCHLFQYLNKTLFILPTLNNIFHQNYKKNYNFSNLFFKYVYIFTLSISFIYLSIYLSIYHVFMYLSITHISMYILSFNYHLTICLFLNYVCLSIYVYIYFLFVWTNV